MSLGIWTIIALALGGLNLLLILLLLSLGKKKDHVAGAKKGLVVILGMLCTLSLIATPLMHMNIIPLNMRVGYYIETKDLDGDGRFSGYKITMEHKVAYYEEMDLNRLDQENSEKGTWTIKGTHVILEFEKLGVREYEIDGLFDVALCIKKESAYRFIAGIDAKKANR